MMTNGPSATIGEVLPIKLARATAPARTGPLTSNTRAAGRPCWSSSMPRHRVPARAAA